MKVEVQGPAIGFRPYRPSTVEVRTNSSGGVTTNITIGDDERPAYFEAGFIVSAPIEFGDLCLPQTFSITVPVTGLDENAPFAEVAAQGRALLPEALRQIALAVEAERPRPKG